MRKNYRVIYKIKDRYLPPEYHEKKVSAFNKKEARELVEDYDIEIILITKE